MVMERRARPLPLTRAPTETRLNIENTHVVRSIQDNNSAVTAVFNIRS